jgi:hypothetical protein
VADVKPAVYEYQLGGGCLTGAPKDQVIVDAILNAIEGARALYGPQGRLTVRIENPPEGSAAAGPQRAKTP